MKTLAALALVALAACSAGPTDTGNPDGGGPATDVKSPAFWGLADDRCLHYTDSEGRERYTIGIEEDDRAVPGVKTFHLQHRFQGMEVESEWLEVKGDQLLLHRRLLQPVGEAATLWRFDAPVVFAQAGLEAGDSTSTTAKAARSAGGATTQEELTVDSSVFSTDPVPALGGTVDAQRFNLTTRYADGTSRTDRLWLAPDKGLVKYDPSGEYDDSPSAEEIFLLTSVETLPAGEPCVTK